MLAFEGTLKRYRFALITSILFNVSLLLLVVPTLLGANEAPTDETSAENAPPTLSEVQTNSSNNSASNNQSGEEDLGTAVENLSPTPLPPTATLLPTSTPEPTATATPLPTNTPTPTATATSLPTDTPEPTPTVTPEPTPTVIPGPNWLRYINLFRVQAGVPPVVENTGWSAGSAAHSRYMLLTGQSVHAEERSSQFFTVEGNESGLNGNIAVSGWEDAPEIWPIDYWISALFHAVPMFDPRVSQMGYGIARDANSWMKMTGTLDIASRRGQDEVPAGVTYPITFPQDGGQTWILKYSLPEFPDPIVSCPGITRASGPPLFALLGTGDLVPHVTATEFRLNGEELPHCVIDETRYVNHENPYQQEQGRKILDKQDAVVILPAQPLQVGQTYEVLIEVNGETITWQFETVEPPEDF